MTVNVRRRADGIDSVGGQQLQLAHDALFQCKVDVRGCFRGRRSHQLPQPPDLQLADLVRGCLSARCDVRSKQFNRTVYGPWVWLHASSPQISQLHGLI